MLVAAAAMAFASCQKEENIAPETISATLTMHADVDATKTYLGEGNTVLWGTGESVQLYVGSGETSKFVASASTDEYNGNASASFTFNIEGVAAAETYSLGGIYPASAARGISSNDKPESYKVALPASQNTEPGMYDPSAYIMVLKPEAVEELPTVYQASFRRAVALNKITLTNVPEDIMSVEIIVPENKYLAGRRYMNLTTGESGEIYESGTQTNVVKVSGDFKEGTFDVWFCSWEVELLEGDALTVKMTSANNIYTRTITTGAKGIKFIEGDLNTLKINMAEAEVESVSNITGKYLIASKTSSGWFLMTSTNGGSYYSATNMVSSSSTVTCADFYNVADVDNYVWDVAKYDNGYSIQSVNTNKYVAYSGTSNHAYANADLGDDVKMSIQLNGQSAVIESMNVAGRKLQYNASTPRFAFYTSSQTAAYMIPWVPDTTPRIHVAETEKSINADGGVVTFSYQLKNLDGQDVTVTEDSDFLSATASDGVVTVTVAANDSDERNATITLSCGEAEDVVLTVKQAAWEEPNTGGGDTQEYTYTWTASSGALGTTTNGTTTKTLNNIDWTIQRSDNSGYTGWTSNVIQIGSKSNPENLTLTTSAISGTIKSVSVACASYSAKHNINISVGGVSYVSDSTPSWSNNSVGTVVGEGNSTGDIEIKFTKGSGARALYVKSITIVYEN